MNFIFNKHRPFRSYLRILKRSLRQALLYIPYRITAPWRKMPDFIIIGVMKGGTTSLFDYLHQHPDMELSREKEVHYFSNHYYRSKNFYRSFFPYKTKNKMTGEATPFYFLHPQVPSRIKKDLPHAKIILLLRDPVLRAYSNYNMIRKIDYAADFDEAIELENMRVDVYAEKIASRPYYVNLNYQSYSYKAKSMYFKQLSNWLRHYQKEELLILKSEDFFRNPKNELKKVYNYLGVQEIYPKDLTPKNQRSYDRLSEVDYQKYKSLFAEDALKLKELLGDHFSW